MKRIRQFGLLGFLLIGALVLLQPSPANAQIPEPSTPGNSVIFTADPCPDGSFPTISPSGRCLDLNDESRFTRVTPVTNAGVHTCPVVGGQIVIYDGEREGRGITCARFEPGALEDKSSGGTPTGDSSSPGSAIEGDCVKLSTPIEGEDQVCSEDQGVIITYVKQVLRFLSGAFGLLAVLAIIIAGIQYMTAGGNPGQVEQAKKRLGNAITAVILLVLMFGILYFLIPSLQ
jgi:type IV secretory pathway VirB2 component (pilin)